MSVERHGPAIGGHRARLCAAMAAPCHSVQSGRGHAGALRWRWTKGEETEHCEISAELTYGAMHRLRRAAAGRRGLPVARRPEGEAEGGSVAKGRVITIRGPRPPPWPPPRPPPWPGSMGSISRRSAAAKIKFRRPGSHFCARLFCTVPRVCCTKFTPTFFFLAPAAGEFSKCDAGPWCPVSGRGVVRRGAGPATAHPVEGPEGQG